MRNKQKETELIEKRNKAYKEANKYEAQIRKSLGISSNEELDLMEEGFFNQAKLKNNNQTDIENSNKIVQLINKNRGFEDEQKTDFKVRTETAAEKIANLINNSRGL
jgi:hypothetical protein